MIEGPSGSGKSSLAARLRAALGFGVLEVGPLFRYAAQLAASARRPPENEVACQLWSQLAAQRVTLDVHKAGVGAACEWRAHDGPFSEPLWAPGRTSDVERCARSFAIRRVVCLAVHNAVAHEPDGLVIVAHRASELGIDFDHGFGLRASYEVRRGRKFEQMGLLLPAPLSTADVVPSSKLALLDTSEISADAVARLALDVCLAGSTGRRPKETSVRSPREIPAVHPKAPV